MDNPTHDPKGLIRESFRIEGISEEECRSIFLDWALSLGSEIRPREAISTLLETYGADYEEHPMTAILKEGLIRADTPRRRGGWRRQVRH